MSVTLKEIYTFLFFLGLFFIPFNEFEGLSFLGEYKNEAASYFFITGFGVLTIDSIFKRKISIPYRNTIFQILILFLVWCVVCTLLNISTVFDSYYKQTSGINRFIRQYISLFLSAFVFVTLYWNAIKNFTIQRILYLIRKIFFYSLLLVFIYGVIEALIVIFGIYQLFPVLKMFEIIPFVNTSLHHNGRISSITYEVPALGNYLITISGWMFSYIITEKTRYRFIPALMVLFLMFFSGSRTALVNVSLQILIFIAALYFKKEYRKEVIKFLKVSCLIIAGILIVNAEKIIETAEEKIESLNFSKNLKKNVSNKSRFGMQHASLEVFKENPIAGVGLGQETYHKIYHYPNWATRDNYEFELWYKNQNEKSFPSAYNIYTRLLAETGIIGMIIFLSLIFLLIKKSWFIWRKGNLDEEKNLSLILLISFIGLSMNWMQTDFFRQYGFWLCLTILVKMQTDEKKYID